MPGDLDGCGLDEEAVAQGGSAEGARGRGEEMAAGEGGHGGGNLHPLTQRGLAVREGGDGLAPDVGVAEVDGGVGADVLELWMFQGIGSIGAIWEPLAASIEQKTASRRAILRGSSL